MTASIVSLRAVTTAAGSTASAAPAATPAQRPAIERATHMTAATAATPPSAAGSSSAHVWKPKSRVESTCSHSPGAGLSIATRRPGSNAPARNACHDPPMVRTAAS